MQRESVRNCIGKQMRIAQRREVHESSAVVIVGLRRARDSERESCFAHSVGTDECQRAHGSCRREQQLSRRVHLSFAPMSAVAGTGRRTPAV